MSIRSWQDMAVADARRRGLDAVAPLLESLGTSLNALREAAAGLEDGSASADEGSAEGNHVASSAVSTAWTPSAEHEPLSVLAARVARGEVKSERLVEDCLAAISRLQPELNAFITVTGDEALAGARAADREAAAGRISGLLHGIPVSLKDLVDQAGVPTTAASQVRRTHVAAADAPVTARLRGAGAMFVGKTNLHEFAFGTTNEDSGFGPARHPVDPSRSPGGSSGGSAVSVATGMALATVGTDTGGSIRIPAAVCGIVGLKPAWGEVPAEGVVPLSRQLDHVGPMTRSVADAWLLYDVMRGASRPAAPTIVGIQTLRIGRPQGYLFDRLDEDVERLVSTAIDALASAGARVTDVDIPHAADTPSVYLPLVLADGAEYHAHLLDTQAGDYTEPVRIRLEMGRYVMAEDYVRALRLRARLRREVDAALAGVDVLALPALAIPAPPLGAGSVPVKGGTEPVRAVMLRCTQLFNITGHPAISVPCGHTAAGLPVGLQLVGRHGATARLLEVALAVEARLARA